MSVKSEWRLHELLFGDDDPFATVILTSGLYVDLTASSTELFDALRRSLEIEGRLFNEGVTCDLKDDGQDCLTCPMYVADRAEEARAPLCRLGRDQRMIEGRFHDAVHEAKHAPMRELACLADELSEIGFIEEADAELLTAAGL